MLAIIRFHPAISCPMRNIARFFWIGIALALCSLATHAQTCAAPGKDGPVTISAAASNINTYFQGNGNLSLGASSLTLGARSGVATALSAGDKLLVVQMQGAAINANNNNCYGDGLGPCTDTNTRAIGSDKAQVFWKTATTQQGAMSMCA
jgi:hypothetical protein